MAAVSSSQGNDCVVVAAQRRPRAAGPACSVSPYLGFKQGVTRVIIGTKAVSDFAWFSRIAEKFPGQVVLGLDARGAMVATHGWLEESTQSVLEFAAQADKLPLAAIIYTDIAKDGMLIGPNIERTAELAEAVETPVIASGGVKEVADIHKLNPIGVAGVVVGRSLYEGTLTLKDALAAAI